MICCIRCTACTDFHLCQSCFNTSIHTSHPFEYRHVSIYNYQTKHPEMRCYGQQKSIFSFTDQNFAMSYFLFQIAIELM